MKSFIGWTLAAATLLGAALPLNAVAQHHDRGWHGDIRYFDSRDMHHWRSGYWHHGSHSGRIGWWWVIGGAWYFYPQPVYPYPDPYRPPVVVVEQAPPPVVVQVPAPAPVLAQPAAPVVPAPQFWYYCDAAKAYYPYVATCPSGWQTVPATPAAGGTQ
jgi:hypothetical protein